MLPTEPLTECTTVLPAWVKMATTLSYPETLQDAHLTPILPMAMAKPLWRVEGIEPSSLSPSLQCNLVSDPGGGPQGGKGRSEAPGDKSRQQRTHAREADRQQEVRRSIRQSSKPPAQAPLFHQASLTKHKFRDKIKDFKMASAEHSVLNAGPLLNHVGPVHLH